MTRNPFLTSTIQREETGKGQGLEEGPEASENAEKVEECGPSRPKAPATHTPANKSSGAEPELRANPTSG